jgi:biopolymer transport protein ExbD
MNLRPRQKEDPEINLTSLIDVVLLLLIFFMMTTTFVTEARLKIQLPQANREPGKERAADPVEIVVTQSGEYVVNGEALINRSPETLTAAVAKIAGDRHDAPVTIRADGRATHQSVVTAMDVVGRLGFRAINIATIKDAEGARPASAPR